jgi:predicted dehydrogenase
MHLEVAKKLANNGVNLLIEKPISNSSKGVRELIDICNKNNCILMTAYNLRFLPSLIEFKKQIELKKIGNIYSVRVEVGQYLPDWRPGCDYKRTVSAQKKLGGGVLLELSHEVDYLMWIFGSIKWVKAHVSKQSNLEIDVEDTANVLLGFESIKGYELTASLNMDFIRHDTKRQCIVIGEKGSLAWNGITGEVSFFGKGSDNWEVLNLSKPERNYTYAEEIKSFFSSIELQVAPCISGEDGLSVVTIIEAIKESNDRDAIVYL